MNAISKRIVSLLCVTCLLVGLVACGNKPVSKSQGDLDQSTSTTTSDGSASTGTSESTSTDGTGSEEATTTGSGVNSTSGNSPGTESSSNSKESTTESTTSKPTTATDNPNFSVTKPNPSVTEGEMIDLALNVYQDLLDNWWTGSAKTGHIRTTDSGKYSEEINFIWEPTMVVLALDTLYQATGYAEIHDRIVAEWNYIKQCYPKYDTHVDAGHFFNWAQDDAGWGAMLYMTAYKHTGDEFALDVACGLIKNCYTYWANGNLATGGLLYDHYVHEDNSARFNSIHAVSLLTAAFDYLEYQDDPQLEKDTMAIYNWLEENMLRDGEYSYVNSSGQKKTASCNDMLYWFNFNQQREKYEVFTGPEFATKPNAITEGYSSVFLGGMMGMASLHSRLYNKTGNKMYLERAQRTLRAINDNNFLVKSSVYVNAGDAWTNSSWLSYWVNDVLTLPGLQKKDIQILNKTANSIYDNARTDDGFYSASWSGPAEDANTAWGRMGWTHDTIMCSATSMHMVFAAALAESMGLG